MEENNRFKYEKPYIFDKNKTVCFKNCIAREIILLNHRSIHLIYLLILIQLGDRSRPDHTWLIETVCCGLQTIGKQ